MKRRHLSPWQSGISLVEALVAMAVMAFGMLALVGVQGSLRQNADIARQRSEAVRIAQLEIERWRAFASLQAGAGMVSFGNLQDGTFTYDDGVEDVALNATYTVTRSISPDTATTPPFPLAKTFTVDVSWSDRNGQAQGVRLSTTVAAVTPELAGTLSLPSNGDPSSLPGGRNRSVPLSARNWGGGFSDFVPPGRPDGDLTGWRFNNLTGEITFCTTTVASTALLTASTDFTCGTTTGKLLSGFVRFALPINPGTGLPVQPNAADAETPNDSSIDVMVSVQRTVPVSTFQDQCFEDRKLTYVAYFCAVPTTTDPLDTPIRWSGRSIVNGDSFSTNGGDRRADHYRVCRFTPVSGCDPAVGSTIWGDPGTPLGCTGTAPIKSRKMTNSDHPLDYDIVTAGLINQNFLVIRAGDGTTAFSCPADDAMTLVNTNLRHHPPVLP